ncbi:MAG: glycosyltransferase [Flavobacteriia bacterium]
MKNKVVLFTSEYPFGNGETFLETEIQYLSKGFDEVVILSSSKNPDQTREIPNNCSATRFDLELSITTKLLSLKGIFNPIFWKELSVIRKVYKLKVTKGIFFTMLVSLYRAEKVSELVQKILVRQHPADKLYFYSYWCDDVALGLAMAQKKIPRIKTLCRIHRWDVYFEESKVGYLPYRHYITGNIGKIYSISEDGINYVDRVWKTGRPDKFVLSRLGINNVYTLKNVSRDYFLIVSCSNLIPVKRVHLIAEALSMIQDKKIHWVHFGDGPERRKIEDIILKFPVNITAELKGRIPNQDIYSYYDEYRPDLFINVSSSEGVPVSIMEAMSFGIPVIATDVGGNREIVNEENGFLILENGIINKIISVVEEVVLMDKVQIETLKASCLKSWEIAYNADLNFNQFVNLIKGD